MALRATAHECHSEGGSPTEESAVRPVRSSAIAFQAATVPPFQRLADIPHVVVRHAIGAGSSPYLDTLHEALAGLFPGAPTFAADCICLQHTPLGQPQVRLSGDLADWSRTAGIGERDIHVSYTHDGDAHLCLLACGQDVAGVGIDIVHLPRLWRPGKDRAYLTRLAMRFMSADEFARFQSSSYVEDDEAFRLRLAAHFSLMEAASKALGTGLRVGAGMGKPESLPMRSICVKRLHPAVEYALAQDANGRLAEIGATKLAGDYRIDGEYLVSAAMARG